MRSAQHRPERTPQRTDEIIRTFFGPANTVWPDQDPGSPAGRRLAPLLQVLRDATEVPAVLPCRRAGNEEQLTAYVIALDPAHATAVAELLTAFVGPSYASFDGLPALLDPDDLIDRAVLDFAGPGVTFTLSSPTDATQARAWTALQQMQAIMKLRPVRSWHAPKPIGRLLSEFEVALAAGDNSASAAVLDHIAASGGLSATNLAHLRVKRLARLGCDTELLRMAGLADVVLGSPPAPVQDAILGAIYASAVAVPLAAGDLDAARENLIEAGTFVPALLSISPSRLSPEAVTVLALAAWVRDDAPLLRRLLADRLHYDRVAQLAPALADAAATMLGVTEPSPVASEDQPASSGPASWLDLIGAVADAPDTVEIVLANQTWRDWDPPADADEAIASVLAQFDNDAAERAWSIVGPFVDADGYQRPAARTARELIHNALTHDRFSPGDLAGLIALTDIVLRSGPQPSQYAELLDDLRSESGRWAGPDRATVVLDLIDLVARAACPDGEARLRLTVTLLRPLHDHRARLEPDQADFARTLSEELAVGLDWPEFDPASAAGSPLAGIPPLKVLLYSLDEGVLDRTAALLLSLAPAADVKLSHDHVGTARLRQQSRGADVIVMATRCATHAATGFIRSNADPTAEVTEADGSGSASLLRAAIEGLQARRMR